MFRQDLYYRLNTLEFRIPSLRERPEDLPLLAEHFLYKHGHRYQKTGLRLDASAMQCLMHYSWPGNLRELSHLLERAVLLCQQSRITERDLGIIHPNTDRISAATLPMMTLDQAELQLIRQALTITGGHKQKAAELLGITKSSLYRRLEKYELAL